MRRIRLGIIGAGRIAERFVPETAAVGDISLEIVCAQHKNRAMQFADRWSIPAYTDQISDFYGKVDAVYIASPHDTHYEYAKAMLEHHIHVLCEKPMVLEAAQAKNLFELAKDSGCVLMEAIKTAYCPGFLSLIEAAKSGIIGEIRDVEACFTKLISVETREFMDERYGGSFTELASYPLLPIIKLLGIQYSDVSFHSQLISNGLDAYTKAVFQYEDAFGLAKTGLLVKSEGQLLIAGTKGYILAKSPWWLTKEFEVHFEDSSQTLLYTHEFVASGLRYEIDAFIKSIGKNASEQVTADESICLAGIMEKFLNKRR